MELVVFESLHSSTQQKFTNGRNKSTDDGQNIFERRKIADPASTRENEILQVQEPEIEEDRDHPIFHIYLTMDMILKALNRSDLLRCRGISSNFNYFATHVLLTSTSPVSLDFEYNWELQQYICSKPAPGSALQNNLNVNSSNTLTSLSKLLETSTDFPCKKYTFRNGILRSKDIQTFFQMHGWDVRALSLDLYCPVNLAYENELNEDELRGERSIDLLRKLLLEQIPNVKSLKLSKFPRLWNMLKQKMYSVEMEKKIQSLKNSDNYPYLTNLKNLIVSVDFDHWANASSKLINEILETAINLENVYSYLSKLILQHNKFHLVQRLPMYASCDNLEMFEQIATYPRSRLRSITLMLSELTTEDYTLIQERFGKALYKILKACSSTLEHIKFMSPCGYLCGPNLRFKLPLLPKVKSILVSANGLYRLNESDCPKEIQTKLASRFFPPGFQFKTTFPHLTQIVFFLASLDDFAAWEDHFDNYEPSLSVKLLIFTDSQTLPSGCISYCSKVFPNTEFLEVRPRYFSFYEASQSGHFNFGRLQELRCDLDLDISSNGNEYPFLDAAFTGYSPRMVQYLHHEFLNSQSQGQLEFFQTLTNTPSRSILNLKDFKILKITVVDRSDEIKAFYPPIFTHVTSLFAFKSHPLLQLQLGFSVWREDNLQKIMRRMEPVRPFAQFQDSERYDKDHFAYCYDEESIMKI